MDRRRAAAVRSRPEQPQDERPPLAAFRLYDGAVTRVGEPSEGASVWWRRFLPLAGTALLLAWPVGRYALKVRDEAQALNVVHEVRRAQERFRTSSPAAGYASSIESLAGGCGTAAPMSRATLADLERVGYDLHLHPSAASRVVGKDCHGRPTVDDYYLGVEPRGAAVAGQRAYGATSRGDVFVFFDGLAPREQDMTAGGLATTSEALSSFKIP